MTLKKVLLLLFIISTVYSEACDVCGCAGQGAFSGIYPQFSSNLIGLRYSGSTFAHPHTALNYNGASRVLMDDFTRTEVWIRMYPSKRVQVLANIPFQVHTRNETDHTTRISGVGDIGATVNYAILQTPDSSLTKKSHVLLGGMSISLPTGPYQARDADLTLLPAQFQIGTGAYGFTPHLIYTVRISSLGINTDLRTTYYTENERSYQPGLQSAAAIRVFYWFKKGRTSLIPHAGLGMEHFQEDTEFGRVKPETGGNIYPFYAGVDVYRPRYFVQFGAHIPLRTSLPASQPVLDLRLGCAVGILF